MTLRSPAVVPLSAIHSTIDRLDTRDRFETRPQQRGTVGAELALLRDFIKLRRAESSRRLIERMRMLAGSSTAASRAVLHKLV